MGAPVRAIICHALLHRLAYAGVLDYVSTIPKERRLQTAAVAIFGTLMASCLGFFLWMW